MRPLTDAEQLAMGKYPEYLLSQLSSVYKYSTQYPTKAELESAKQTAEASMGGRRNTEHSSNAETSTRDISSTSTQGTPTAPTDAVVPVRTTEPKVVVPQTPVQQPQNAVQGTLNFDAVPAQVVPPKTSTESTTNQTATDIQAKGRNRQYGADEQTLNRADQIARQHRAASQPINAEFD